MPAGPEKKDLLNVFEKTLMLNKATAQLPEPILIAHFTEGALAALDRYTTMVWPQQMREFEKNMMNEFTGIGVEISKRTGELSVASLLPDTPAYRAGLDAGDVIEAVDGLETRDMSLICAVHKITGPKGTKVNLTIKSAGSDQTHEVVITRDKIIIPSIRGWKRTSDGDWLYMIDDQDKIGYVRITSFATETASTLEKILVDLESQGVKGLVLDVRGNPGGLLSSAVDVADKFLNGGLVVRTQPRHSIRRWPSYESAKEKGTHPNYPLVILIDSSSASGSEILAGALADKSYRRAILVGDRTHGKGSVQSATPYTGGGSKLKYTMAYYHLPSDQRVLSKEEAEKRGTKDWGVAPDVAVKLRSDELRKLIDVQRDNDVLMQAGNGHEDQENKRHSLEETISTDPQLAIGLLVVKAKLRQNEAILLAGNR
jgi:carboxyl-terminal processing protease